MGKYKGFLLFLAVLFFHGTASFSAEFRLEKQYSPVPKEARDYFKTLPNSFLSFDFLISQLMRTSESYKSIRSRLIDKEVVVLKAKTFSETNFEASGQWVNNRNEATTPFSPAKTIASDYSIGLSKSFQTGSTLSASLEHNDSEISFLTFPQSNFKSTSLSLQLSQSLWKNFFGKNWKTEVKNSQEVVKITELEVDEATLDWMDGFRGLFYRSWVLQKQVLESEKDVKRKKRLLNITKIQFKRGTAEEPDVLQVKKSLLLSQAQLSDNRQSLEEIWRFLVISLNMPNNWLNINPILVPLKLDDPEKEAEKKCLLLAEDEEVLKEPNTRVTLLEKKRDNSIRSLNSSKNKLKPELNFNVGLVANGVDPSVIGKTFEEAFSVKNPQFFAGISLKMSFENLNAKADDLRAKSEKVRAESDLSSVKNDIKVEWYNACQSFRNWQRKKTYFKKSFQRQKKRIDLEERRFQLSRVPLNNIILASSDAMSSALSHYTAEVELKTVSWEVLRLSGEMKKHMKYLQKRMSK